MPTEVFGDNTGDDYSGTEDTQLSEFAPTTNYGTAAYVEINKYGSGDWNHGCLSWSGMSSLPSSITVSSSSINLTGANGTTHNSTWSFYRLLRNWVEAQATWNIYSTGNNWGTAGGTNSSDRSTTLTCSGSIGTDQYALMTFSGSQLDTDIENIASGSVSNYGWHIERTDGSNDSNWRRFASDAGTDGERPYLSVTYTTGAAASSFLTLLGVG